MIEIFKKVIICQGDKKELEEITCQEYEYIKPEEIKLIFLEKKPTDYSRNIFSSFIYIYVREAFQRTLKREMYKKALKLNADAIIHYSEQFAREEGGFYGFAEGTPLRKKRYNNYFSI